MGWFLTRGLLSGLLFLGLFFQEVLKGPLQNLLLFGEFIQLLLHLLQLALDAFGFHFRIFRRSLL